MKKLLILLLLGAVCLCAETKSVPLGWKVSIALSENGGTPPFTYQWKRNNVDIPGATAPVLVLMKFTLADAGTYTCVVSNTAGSITSDQAVLAAPRVPTKPITAILIEPPQDAPLIDPANP